jgi:putative ABC transport system substrate-binding protein
MDRRTFLAGTGAVFLAAPLAVEAQVGKPRRIGYLGVAPRPPDDAFKRGLREAGYVDGQNLIVEYRWGGDGSGKSYAELANGLIKLNVEIIVAVASPATRAAMDATKTIPIIFVDIGDPVAYGFVPNLSRPGGNVTGLSAALTETAPKAVQLLKEIVPNLSRVGVLGNWNNPGAGPTFRALEAAAPALGVQLQSHDVREPSQFPAFFTALEQRRPGGMFVIPDHFLYTQREGFLDFFARNRIPAAYGLREYVPAGGLIAIGADRAVMFSRAALYVDKILKGAKPADLPVEQPTRFELLINLKTAKALGLTIPPSLLGRADEVIQ